jgi:hypothetical protein
MEHINTVAITDYKIDPASPNLAQVVISYTGKFNKETLRASLREKFDNRVTPVEDSFHEIKAGAAVGFLRANREVRMPDQQELRASYRKVGASNIMMSDADNSLWEVKEGKSGKYLARTGQEDLSELVHASINRRTDIPGLRHLATASVANNEFVSFVSKSGDLDHGFVMATNKENTKIKLVSFATRTDTIVPLENVTAISRVPLPQSFVQQMATAGISREEKSQASDYWKKLYEYAPNYLSDVLDQVDHDTVA